MLIPHLHFPGSCREAIALYEKAFAARAEICDIAPDGRVSHARMDIHGQTVYLNDRFGNRDMSQNCAVHMIVTFDSPQALRRCCDVLSEGGRVIDPLKELPYSPLAGNIMDRFGVMWGFMAV